MVVRNPDILEYSDAYGPLADPPTIPFGRSDSVDGAPSTLELLVQKAKESVPTKNGGEEPIEDMDSKFGNEEISCFEAVLGEYFDARHAALKPSTERQAPHTS